MASCLALKGGSAGGSGDGGPHGGKAETLKAESRNATTDHGLRDYEGRKPEDRGQRADGGGRSRRGTTDDWTTGPREAETRGQRAKGAGRAKARNFPDQPGEACSRFDAGQQAAIERFLKGEVLLEPQQGAVSSAPNQVLAERPSQAGTECGPAYVFRWTGRRWEVVCGGGRPFRLRNTLGARYLELPAARTKRADPRV